MPEVLKMKMFDQAGNPSWIKCEGIESYNCPKLIIKDSRYGNGYNRAFPNVHGMSVFPDSRFIQDNTPTAVDLEPVYEKLEELRGVLDTYKE